MHTYQFAFTLAPIMESYPSLAQFDDMNEKELIIIVLPCAQVLSKSNRNFLMT